MVEVDVEMLSLCQRKGWSLGWRGELMNLRNVQRLDGLHSDAKPSSHLALAPWLNGADEVSQPYEGLEGRPCTSRTGFFGSNESLDQPLLLQKNLIIKHLFGRKYGFDEYWLKMIRKESQE